MSCRRDMNCGLKLKCNFKLKILTHIFKNGLIPYMRDQWPRLQFKLFQNFCDFYSNPLNKIFLCKIDKEYGLFSCNMQHALHYIQKIMLMQIKMLKFLLNLIGTFGHNNLSDKMYWVSDNPSWELYKSFLIHGRWSFRLLVLYCKFFVSDFAEICVLSISKNVAVYEQMLLCEK